MPAKMECSSLTWPGPQMINTGCAFFLQGTMRPTHRDIDLQNRPEGMIVNSNSTEHRHTQ